jgi:hypothetical protein
MKSLNGTDQRAVSIAAVYAWFCNDVCHFGFGLLVPKLGWEKPAIPQTCSRSRANGSLATSTILSTNGTLLKDENNIVAGRCTQLSY